VDAEVHFEVGMEAQVRFDLDHPTRLRTIAKDSKCRGPNFCGEEVDAHPLVVADGTYIPKVSAQHLPALRCNGFSLSGTLQNKRAAKELGIEKCCPCSGRNR